MARIRERSPGVWEVTVSAGRDVKTGRYVQRSRTVRGSKRVATETAAALLTELRGQGVVTTKDSVGHLLDAYLDHCRTRGLAPKTIRGYGMIAEQVADALGRVELRRLTAASLDTYYGGLRRRGLSPRTIHHHHAFVRGALRQAVRWGWITRSPADSATPPRVPTTEPAVPSVDQVKGLFALTRGKHPDLASLLWVAATTGMRRGELCGLRWSDLDFEHRTLTVRRSISDIPGALEVRSTKTGRVRRIAMDPMTEKVLCDQLARARARSEAVEAVLSPEAYVWSQDAAHREPWRPDRVTGILRGIRTRAGMPDVHLHHLRHFAATMMLANGVDVRTAAGRLGHAEPSMTLKVYAHALEQRDREAADLLAGLLGSPV